MSERIADHSYHEPTDTQAEIQTAPIHKVEEGLGGDMAGAVVDLTVQVEAKAGVEVEVTTPTAPDENMSS